MKDNVEQLCDRAREGDLASASELVSHFYQRIYAYFRRLCGSDDDAADLTQKTFSKGWQSLSSYRQTSTFSTWLHGIAHHVYADWRRKRSAGELQTDDWWNACPDESPTPYEDAAEKELARQLYQWVDQLDEEKKQAVHLHYYQNLSLSETADALGIATSTVKYRLREALEFLRSKAAEPRFVPERRTI
jgi:RNA polymerase sigma-70 factor (ECF subfamily)